jgi:hypothetical protein
MNGEFHINILDKVEKIEDVRVRKLCEIVIKEAQKNIHEARNIAIDRVNTEISNNLLKISEGVL